MYRFLSKKDINYFIASYWIEKCNNNKPYTPISVYRDIFIQEECNKVSNYFVYKAIKYNFLKGYAKVYIDWFYFDIDVLIEISRKK